MQQPEPEKILFLPHLPVDNPNKTGKVRRLAKAAAKYKSQFSNSNLIARLDLLNKLVGIFPKFRENPVNILCDIVSMVMLIGIWHENQSGLRFLWPNAGRDG